MKSKLNKYPWLKMILQFRTEPINNGEILYKEHKFSILERYRKNLKSIMRVKILEYAQDRIVNVNARIIKKVILKLLYYNGIKIEGVVQS